jgi:PAS domain S-box-containing protein
MVVKFIEKEKAEEKLKTAYELLLSLFEATPNPIHVSDRDGQITLVNNSWQDIVGLNREQVLGRRFDDIFPETIARKFKRGNRSILRTGVPIEREEWIEGPNGARCFHTTKFPLQDSSGQIVSVGSISVDVTTRRRIQQELTKREAEVRGKSRQLGEMNTALRVLLRQREEDAKELEERIVSNVKELVLPYIQKLKKMHLGQAQMSYVEIIETHLNDITAPLLRRVVSQFPHMTAREIQVAILVKDNKTNKEIADILNVSVNAVEIHRYNLRKKLGIRHKKMNLRSYLLSLDRISP